jgi:hypothetical protein
VVVGDPENAGVIEFWIPAVAAMTQVPVCRHYGISRLNADSSSPNALIGDPVNTKRFRILDSRRSGNDASSCLQALWHFKIKRRFVIPEFFDRGSSQYETFPHSGFPP